MSEDDSDTLFRHTFGDSMAKYLNPQDRGCTSWTQKLKTGVRLYEGESVYPLRVSQVMGKSHEVLCPQHWVYKALHLPRELDRIESTSEVAVRSSIAF